VSWAEHEGDAIAPAFAVNGNGYFVPEVPLGNAAAWLCGSTFQRGETDLAARAADHQANLERLRALLPSVAAQLTPAFKQGAVHAWTGVRCAATDRRPLVGELRPGLWTSTAMGSRGLTFARLCAELLASRLHGEPLALEHRLAQSLDALRALPAAEAGA
jgi:tRNA 5-methylaminomethyl-2-thiouridine biosynthesis bifunctional protein